MESFCGSGAQRRCAGQFLCRWFVRVESRACRARLARFGGSEMSDADLRAPALSVILPTDGGFPSIRITFQHLQQQTIADRLELIVLTPKIDNFDLNPAESARFHGVRLVK